MPSGFEKRSSCSICACETAAPPLARSVSTSKTSTSLPPRTTSSPAPSRARVKTRVIADSTVGAVRDAPSEPDSGARVLAKRKSSRTLKSCAAPMLKATSPRATACATAESLASTQ